MTDVTKAIELVKDSKKLVKIARARMNVYETILEENNLIDEARERLAELKGELS